MATPAPTAYGNAGATLEMSLEERLGESMAFSSSVFEASPDCAKVLDANGHLLSMNMNGRHLMEIDDFEPLVGAEWAQLWPKDLQPLVRQSVEVARQGQIFRFQAPAPTAKGTQKFWDVVVSPVRSAHGALRLLSVSRDVSEMKRVEEELRQSQERYRQMAEAQKRFVHDAAHEFRTPLTVIMGNLELINRFENMSPEDRQSALGEAASEAARLSRMVGDLLSLAKGDAGFQLKLQPISWSAVVEACINELRHVCVGQHLESSIESAVMVQGSRDHLKQVVLQLLENACKYTPAGGKIEVSLETTHSHAVLRVRDTGVGIGEDELPKVFDRFYRADNRLENDPGGTGLGLSIVKNFVGLHGGQILVQSQVGVGTTMSVELPRIF